MNRTLSLIALAGLALAACATAPAMAVAPDALAGLLESGLTADPALAGIAFGGLIINRANLANLFTGFKAAFQRGLGQAPGQHSLVAMTVPSTTSKEEYGWLGSLPNMREWIGDRVVHAIGQHDYSIKNKDWELTIGVPRNAIDDDQYGIYSPLFEEMGRSVAAHPDQLVWPLLRAGWATPCYDGQNFFDTDHPVLDEDGQTISVANTDGGAGEPWFLMDLSRAIKPVIYQERKKPQFVAKTAPTDDNVFNAKEFVYGVDSRAAAGFGLWQLAWGSKQTLNKAAYATARAALQGMKGDHGRPLGLKATHLVVPPSLEGAGLEILNAERDAQGATNVYRGTAQLIVASWL